MWVCFVWTGISFCFNLKQENGGALLLDWASAAQAWKHQKVILCMSIKHRNT